MLGNRKVPEDTPEEVPEGIASCVDSTLQPYDKKSQKPGLAQQFLRDSRGCLSQTQISYLILLVLLLESFMGCIHYISVCVHINIILQYMLRHVHMGVTRCLGQENP